MRITSRDGRRSWESGYGDWRDHVDPFDRSTWPNKMAAEVEGGADATLVMHRCFVQPLEYADPVVQKFTSGEKSFTAVTKFAPAQVDDELREFSGIASAPQIDRQNEIVAVEGVRYKNPSVLLWAHRHDQPIGQVWFSRSADAIHFRAKIPRIDAAGSLRDSVESAWGAVKARIVTSVSIGFRALETEMRPDGVLVYTRSELLELSLVSVPALPSAQIDATTIKGLQISDLRLAAASREFGANADKPATNETLYAVVVELADEVVESIADLAVRLTALEQRR